MNSNDKKQCRLCRQLFDNTEMSEEHFPARSVGNNDIVKMDLGKYIENVVDNNMKNDYMESIYPKGRTARTLCRKCNTFIGKYDEAYLKFYKAEGNPKTIKGYQAKTKVDIVKSIYAKFLSIPETQNEEFDYLDFIKDENINEYEGLWRCYFVKRNICTDPSGIYDIGTRKYEYNEGVIYEFSDSKFVFYLMNFDKHNQFKMNNIFDVLDKDYSLVEPDSLGGYHGMRMMFM